MSLFIKFIVINIKSERIVDKGLNVKWVHFRKVTLMLQAGVI